MYQSIKVQSIKSRANFAIASWLQETIETDFKITN